MCSIKTISRARFSVALSRLDHAAIENAIARIELPAGAPGVMPPPESRQLDAPARLALVEYLQTQARPADDDVLLERVAALGMSGGP